MVRNALTRPNGLDLVRKKYLTTTKNLNLSKQIMFSVFQRKTPTFG